MASEHFENRFVTMQHHTYFGNGFVSVFISLTKMIHTLPVEILTVLIVRLRADHGLADSLSLKQFGIWNRKFNK
jgi:hypothetical protein